LWLSLRFSFFGYIFFTGGRIMSDEVQFPQTQLAVPFKPFTVDEVVKFTGCDLKLAAFWYENLPIAYKSEVGFKDGVDYMGAFGIFCGQRWWDEGAGPERSSMVVNFLAHVKQEWLEGSLEQGLAFPAFVPSDDGAKGMFVQVPDKPLARKLDLRMLYGEFKKRLKDWEDSKG
jgi:hypothetical protein